MTIKNNNSRGFTAVEVIISVSVGILLMLVAADLLVSVVSNPTSQMASLDSIEQAKTVVSVFVDELRSSAVGNDGSYPVTLAQENEIIFYSKFRTTGNAVNRVRYYFSDGVLYKGTTIPTGLPLSYDLDSEVVRPVVTNVLNQGSPVFYYYDGNYNGSGQELSQPVNINQIRFAKINLIMENLTSKQSQSTFPISGGAAIRNLKDNLGN